MGEEPSPTRPARKVTGWTYVVATAAAWSVAFPAMKVASQGFEPAELAAARIWGGALLVVPLALRHGLPRLRPREWAGALAGAVLGFSAYYALLVLGIQWTTAGTAGALMALLPMITALLSALLFRERHGANLWIGFAIATCGAIFIATSPGVAPGGLLGVLLILLALVGAAAYMVLQQRLVRRHGSLQALAVVLALASLTLLPWAPGTVQAFRDATADQALAAIVLGVVSTALAYYFLVQAMRTLSASRSVSATYLVPAFGFVTAWAWLGEVPSWPELFGAATAVAGVAIARRAPHARNERVRVLEGASLRSLVVAPSDPRPSGGVARVWQGWTSAQDADRYEHLLLHELLPGLRGIPGYKGGYVVRRNVGDECAFLTFLHFESLDAVRAFAGDDHETAVIHPETQGLFTRYEKTVSHYEVRAGPGDLLGE